MSAQYFPIDFDVLNTRLGSAKHNQIKWLKKFSSRALDTLEEIHIAQGKSDFLLIAALAHRIRSPAEMVGAIEFSGFCQKLEVLCEERSISVIVDLIGELEINLEQISHFIEVFENGGNQSDKNV